MIRSKFINWLVLLIGCGLAAFAVVVLLSDHNPQPSGFLGCGMTIILGLAVWCILGAVLNFHILRKK